MRPLALVCLLAACSASAAPGGKAARPGGSAPALTPDEEACERSDGAACLRAGREIMKGAPSVQGQRGSRAFLYYERACRRQVWEACAEYGTLQIVGNDSVARNPEAGEATLRSACDHGSGLGCANLGWYLASKDPVPADELAALRPRTVEILDKACAASDFWSCRVIGMAYAFGVFPTEGQDLVKAEAPLDKACKAEIFDACVHLARVVGSRTTPPPDLASARRLLTHACEGGHGSGCAYLGGMQYTGQGGPVDEDAALISFTRGCELDDADACYAAGSFHGAGPVIRLRDARKGEVELARSCDLGKAEGCGDAARLILHDEHPTPEAASRAIELFRRGCMAGQAAACSDLGVAYGKGQGVPQDLGRARELFQKACDSGYQPACDNLKLF